MSRRLPIKHVKNFRDFGDYGAGSRRIKKGLLYRSAHHATASEGDLAAMAALNLRVIVDLRHGHERATNPSRRWQEFAATVIENHDDERTPQQAADEAAFHAYLASPEISAAGLMAFSLDWYRKAPLERRHIDLYARYFHALASADGAILIHCSRGKDRTGILAALTHHIAGVSRDDILEDYLLENGSTGSPADLGHDRDVSEDVRRALVDLKPEYLDAGLGVMIARYGSIDGYLAGALGVDAKLRAAIEERILE